MSRKHLGQYPLIEITTSRYRVCRICWRVIRNPWGRPLLHNGRKGRG